MRSIRSFSQIVFLFAVQVLLVTSLFGQQNAVSSPDTTREKAGHWALGIKMTGDSRITSPGIIARYILSETDAIEASVNLYVQFQSTKEWHRYDPDGVKNEDNGNIGTVGWKFDLFWRRQAHSDRTFKSFWRIGLGSSDSYSFHRSDDAENFSITFGPVGVYGWEWRPTKEFGIFAELGGCAYYTYYRSKDFDETDDGVKFERRRYTYNYLYTGISSAIGITFYL